MDCNVDISSVIHTSVDLPARIPVPMLGITRLKKSSACRARRVADDTRERATAQPPMPSSLRPSIVPTPHATNRFQLRHAAQLHASGQPPGAHSQSEVQSVEGERTEGGAGPEHNEARRPIRGAGPRVREVRYFAATT